MNCVDVPSTTKILFKPESLRDLKEFLKLYKIYQKWLLLNNSYEKHLNSIIKKYLNMLILIRIFNVYCSGWESKFNFILVKFFKNFHS